MNEALGLSREVVEKIPVFEGFPKHEIEIISEYLKLARFKPFEYVFKEGDPYGSAYFLIEGAVQILKRVDENNKQKVLAEIRVPQLFGELALISRGNRCASVLTIEPLLVAELSCENFEQLITFHPEISVSVIRRIANIISNRLKVSNKNYVHICAEMETCL